MKKLLLLTFIFLVLISCKNPVCECERVTDTLNIHSVDTLVMYPKLVTVYLSRFMVNKDYPFRGNAKVYASGQLIDIVEKDQIDTVQVLDSAQMKCIIYEHKEGYKLHSTAIAYDGLFWEVDKGDRL